MSATKSLCAPAVELSEDAWGLVLERASALDAFAIACACKASYSAALSMYRKGSFFVTHIDTALQNVNMLEWALSLPNFPLSDPRVLTAAARHGNLAVLQRLHQELGKQAIVSDAVRELLGHAAAEGGNLEVLQWVDEEYGLVLDEKLFAKSVCAGRIEALQWLRSQGCPWSKRACAKAAERGRLGILQWLRQEGCKWDEETCRKAAEHGHVDVLQYAHENDCPWDKWTCATAAWSGQLEALQYARQQGCPWDTHTYYNASANKQTHILEFLDAAGFPGATMAHVLAN
mmetsp:Transcript_9234/g.33863  ORF Transcript_9234/g.33863 Transcript_9234/m.33863 type:complete len:288 (-) Transcript_9234:82-945(-)